MPKYYVLDENKNLVESYTKEQFLALLEQAIEDGDLESIDADSAFVSKFKSLLNGTTHHLEFVTQAQYNQLVADEELVPNTYYFIIDDETAEEFEEEIETLKTKVEQLEQEVINLNTNAITVYEHNYHEANLTDLLNEADNYYTNNDQSSSEVAEDRISKIYKGAYTDINLLNCYIKLISYTATQRVYEVKSFGAGVFQCRKATFTILNSNWSIGYIDYVKKANVAETTDFTNGASHEFDLSEQTQNPVIIPSSTTGLNELKTKYCFVWFSSGVEIYIVGLISPVGAQKNFYSQKFVMGTSYDDIYLLYSQASAGTLVGHEGDIILYIEGYTPPTYNGLKLHWKPLN